ncbi:HNH endonuclease signature motif containing protein [Brevibacterium samyangense]|uniref:HNH nuclease domain-containing protein n=1 Tax=Brevibacterium samyangense TaxID=366888 RepID=A0ABP5EP04_9MICO
MATESEDTPQEPDRDAPHPPGDVSRAGDAGSSGGTAPSPASSSVPTPAPFTGFPDTADGRLEAFDASGPARLAAVAQAQQAEAHAFYTMLEAVTGYVVSEVIIETTAHDEDALANAVPPASLPEFLHGEYESIAATVRRWGVEVRQREAEIAAERAALEAALAWGRDPGSEPDADASADAAGAGTDAEHRGEVRRREEPGKAEGIEGRVLVPLPALKPTKALGDWVSEHLTPEHLVNLSALLRKSAAQAFGFCKDALTVVHGLPGFFARARAGEFGIDHVRTAARIAGRVPVALLSKVDRYLSTRRADVTPETFRNTLGKLVRALVPPAVRDARAFEERRVDVEHYGNGTAALILTGPALLIEACYRRVEALARSVFYRKPLPGQGAGAGGADGAGVGGVAGERLELIEHRNIAQLMFDILSLSRPQVTTRRMPATRYGSETTDLATGEGAEELVLELPDAGDYLRNQAQVVVTVPYLSVFGNLNGNANGNGDEHGAGHGDGTGRGNGAQYGTGGGHLPGTFPDGSPVPAEVARTLAGHSRTLVRVLTDPATGTPIDARAKRYAIPPDVRATLIQQWRYCTAPGCTRQAAKSEMDHIREYNHENPDAGGLTVLENLHPLCKRHHQAKTDRRLRVFKTPDGGVRWVLPYGNEVTVFPPGDPVEVMHAEQFRRIAEGDGDEDGGEDGSGYDGGDGGPGPGDGGPIVGPGVGVAGTYVDRAGKSAPVWHSGEFDDDPPPF